MGARINSYPTTTQYKPETGLCKDELPLHLLQIKNSTVVGTDLAKTPPQHKAARASDGMYVQRLSFDIKDDLNLDVHLQ